MQLRLDGRAARSHFAIMMVGIFLMGFTVSLLINVDLGMDSFTFFNVQLSRILGISYGTCTLMVHAVFLLFVLWKGRDLIGLGTLANMFLIGYLSDFFRWVWRKTLPADLFTQMPSRAVIFALALAVFLFGCGLYMNGRMGVSPFDAIPIMLCRGRYHLPFAAVRMIYDFLAIFLGCLLGGHPTIGNVLMVIFLGPVTSAIGRSLSKLELRRRLA